MDDTPICLVKVTGRQKRPKTGDVFRVRTVADDYYFGLVIDGSMETGPLASGSILLVIFEGSSTSSPLLALDEIVKRQILMPPTIVNQRPWTLGYAETLGNTDQRPDIEYVLDRLSIGKLVNRHGQEVQRRSDGLVGVWGLGNEKTLADEIERAVRQ